MKNLLLFLLLFTLVANGQVTNEGQPLSWEMNLSKSVNAKELPVFDMSLMNEQDAINDDRMDIPFRFGYMHSVDYGFEDGVWTNLENGDRIWRILISSEGALSLNFIFDDFYIPEGGNLFLYNDDRSDLLGAYTSIQNQESGILGTWMVNGDKIWIEYYEPAAVNGQGRLHIAKATHRYRGLQKPAQTKGLGDSDTCNVDVDCAIGDDYDYIKDHNKRSVALINLGNSLCTGTLINNTSNDGTPYFLTADHCYSNPSSWAFLFGWISPDPSCATTQASSNGSQSMTMSSATLRSRYESTDFVLVELNSQVPDDWDRVYAGWDKTDNTPDFTVGIHHPEGDIMKVSRDDDSPQKGVTTIEGQTVGVWSITSAGGGWETGITAGGSSGSALFDPAGKIIGQLFGGSSNCQFTGSTNDNGQGDVYGRFGLSWDGGGISSNRLSDWLDPSGTNTDILNSFPVLDLDTFDYDLELESIDSPNSGALVSDETIVVTVSNNGDQSASEFEISYQVNEGTLISEIFTGTLSSGQSVQYSFSETYDFSEAGQYEITASIAYTNDEDNDNNSITKTIINTSSGGCPDEYELPIVWRDNFECHDAFAIDNIEGWTGIDGEGGTTWGASAVDFTNEEYIGSGIIWNNSLANSVDGTDISNWSSYEGTQGLYFFASGSGGTTFPNDDWMIGPEFTIDGVSSPSLTFWAKSLTDQYGLDRFQIAIGTSTDPADFTVISAGAYEEAPTDWTQFEYDLSAYDGQTVRVGIHCVSNDSFVLQMDSFVVEGTLGVNDVQSLDMNIYPNPVDGNFVTIQTPISGVKYVEVFDITGKRLINSSLSTDSLEVSSLSAGIYLIKVTVEGQSKISKLVVR
ncbi:choice-of-anchor J domain-containing protein [Flavobacteriaceae bacterium]|nr:choice-of-anchor J domain-containing protein [Flavobacteriaceae bacterium]